MLYFLFFMKERFAEFYSMLALDRRNSAWSRQDTFLHRYEELLSEVKEIKESLDNKDDENFKEEVGDALWDLLFLMVMAEEKGIFTAKEVIEGAIAKLKRRKPWIFTGKKLSIDEEVKRWTEVKKLEKESNS